MYRAAYAKLSPQGRRKVRAAAGKLVKRLDIGLPEALEILAAVGRKMVEEGWTPQS